MPEIRYQKVSEIYDSVVGKPATVVTQDVLRKAVDAMIANPVSQKVYVTDANGKLLGVISMGSLLEQVGYRIGARKTGVTSFIHMMKDILEESVEHFMKKPVPITRETDLQAALKLMLESGLNDLPVVDEKGILVGELNGLEILVTARKLFKEQEPKKQ